MSPSATAGPYRSAPPPPDDDVPPRAEWCNARIEPRSILFPAKCRFAYRIGGKKGAWCEAEVSLIGKDGNGDAFTRDDVREAVEGYVGARLAEHEMVAPIRAGAIR